MYKRQMYIRIASNDFFAISKDVVSKMISGEYDAEQASQSFNTQLLEESTTSENIVLEPQKTYSNIFHTDGGNEAYSVMANTLRGIYGTDVLIADVYKRQVPSMAVSSGTNYSDPSCYDILGKTRPVSYTHLF